MGGELRIACPIHGPTNGKSACCPEAIGYPSVTGPIREYLLWARANNFRIREIEADGIRLVVDDLGEVSPPAGPQPRSAHEAFAEKFNIPYREDDDDEEAMS